MSNTDFITGDICVSNSDGCTFFTIAPTTECKVERIDEEMNKILNIYKERKERKITKEFDELVEKEYNEVEFIQVYNNLVKAFEDALKELYEDETNKNEKYMRNTGISCNMYKYSLIGNTRSEIFNSHKDEMNEKLKEVENLVNEVQAMLDLTSDYDKQIEILKNYNIIDKKTLKINA